MKKIALLFLTLILSASEPIAPIPHTSGADINKALLGQELFFETALSRDGSTSCFSCHNVYEGGADNKAVSVGFAGKEGDINSPTVLNARYNFTQFWNGRAKDLYAQADGPITNPVEHNMDKETVEKILNSSKEYKEKFKKIYKKENISYQDAIDAIVEFENALITPHAKFDKYLHGEIDLEIEEKEGYKLFKQYGCITCHNGINIGGNAFQKMGTFIPYKTPKQYPDKKSLTGKAEHANVFKVPTLRNIALTAPYFHDAATSSLDEAVKLMSYYNLGIEMPKEDIRRIVLFLHTLTGEKPKILEMP
ncbi:MAG: cytochrome c peroxidase [Sulfurimonadaceae bacterium]|jgi:cytochrome c peroxidase|nr:cytochrome c peroxidase [Sulfurimonadaceae bacterium]